MGAPVSGRQGTRTEILMNEKPPSTPGSGQTGVFKRVMRAIKKEPWSREEIQDLLKEADSVIDPQEQDMLTGVFEVSET